MAIASIRTTPISRGKGKSSVAAAAYRSGEKLYNEREQQGYDYTRKLNIAYTEILAPDNAPNWAYNRQQLWNAVEQSETRCNSRTAREIRIALPKELTLEQNIAAARDYAQTFVNQRMVVDFSVHNNEGNIHAHYMLTTRAIDETGFGEKVRAWDKKEALQGWHKEYENVVNRHLEQAGCPERIDIRSYAEQGIEQIPTIHLGHYSHSQEQQGIATIRGNINREIAEKNHKLAVCDQALAKADAIIQKEQEALANEKRIDEMYRKAAEARGLKLRHLEPHEIEEHIQQRREREPQKEQQPRELTPEQVEEYQRRAQQRGYHPEPRRLLESEFANPKRREDEQQQERQKEEEPSHKPDTKPRRMSLEELDRMYREKGQEYNERRKRERERERERDGPDIPM